MRKSKIFVSALLAMCIIGTVFSVPVGAAAVSSGVMLSFNAGLAGNTSGNFWLNDTGKQMVFIEKEGSDQRMSLTFTNHGTNDIEAQLRVVSSSWQQVRGAVKVTVPAGESANAELMNLNLQEGDIYYFYLSGLTQSSRISFKANYAEVDYTALTASSMQGPGASTFSAQVLYAEPCRITLEENAHVRYTVALNNSIFSKYRNLQSGVITVPAGERVQVIASADEGYGIDSILSGEKTATRLSNYTFTAAADTGIKGVAINMREAIANGVYLEFNDRLETSEGNFWLDKAGLAMFYGEDAKKADIVFRNYGTEDITAMLRVVSASWQEVRFVQSVSVPAGGAAAIEAENVVLAAGDVVYLNFKNLTPESKLGFFSAGAAVDYSLLTASSMQGTGADTFAVKTDMARPVTIRGTAAEGAAYNVTLHGMKKPYLSGAAEFTEVVAAGTLIQVEAVGDAVEGLIVGTEKKDKTYRFQAEDDVLLCAAVSDTVKIQNGLTLTFHDSLTANSGNFWLKQAGNPTFVMDGDTRLSATVYNEGKNEIAAVFRVVNSQWETIAQNAKVAIPAGESSTIEFMNMAVNDAGDIYYMYFEGLTAETKLRIVFNHTQVDYSLFTAEVLEGTGAGTFTVSAERVEAAILKLEKNPGVTYTVSLNGSEFPSYTRVESLETALLPGTTVEILAYAPEGMAITGWEKDGVVTGSGKTLRFTAEGAAELKAIAEETAKPSSDGDAAGLLLAAVLVLSGVSFIYTVKKRKNIYENIR